MKFPLRISSFWWAFENWQMVMWPHIYGYVYSDVEDEVLAEEYEHYFWLYLNDYDGWFS
jgi:hypothetical protein